MIKEMGILTTDGNRLYVMLKLLGFINTNFNILSPYTHSQVSVYSKAWNIRSGHGQIYKY